MMSESEEKGNSSSNDNAGRLISGEECAGSNSEENDATRVLQPFFVADTLEDDESIIPPSQDDSELLIPSTPAYENKSEKRSQNIEANDSTLSILEETCVLERKTQCNDSFGENAISTACNESDMTQDLAELEPTQPIISSNLQIEHSFTGESNNTNKNKVEEEEDDEWQLKFSETQTQEALINLQKNDQSDEEPETQKILSAINDENEEDDDDLPATLSIEVPPREDGEVTLKNKEPEIKDDVEVLETQSDDEIEPSQSCLSEYKGETISASFKAPSVVESTNEEIPDLCPEKETKNEESNKSDMNVIVIDESEKRTETFSETEPKHTFNDTKTTIDNEYHQVQEISIENNKNVNEEKHSISDAEDKRTKNSNLEVGPVDNSVSSNISKESTLKVCEEKKLKMIETNGNQIEEIEILDDVVSAEIESKKTKNSKIIGKKETKSKLLESSANDFVINLEEHNIEMKKDDDKCIEEMSNSVGISKTKDKSNVEVIEIDEEEKKQLVPNTTEVDDEAEIIEVSNVAKEVETSKLDSLKEIEVQEPKAQQECELSNVNVILTQESIKTTEIVPDSQPSKVSSENLPASPKHTSDEKIETPSKSFAKPSVPVRNFAFSRKQRTQNQSEISYEKPEKKIASFKDLETLENFFKNVGVTMEQERLDGILSKPNEEIEFRLAFKIVNFEIFLKDFSFENEHRRDCGISPVCSSSTATSSTLSSKLSVHSGEMADISGQSSGEMFPKTSTQKSPPKAIGSSETFEGKGLGENLENVSPVIPFERNTKSTAKRKRGGKKNAQSSSSDLSNINEPKSKRGKGKSKAKVMKDKNKETEESEDIVPEEKPKKPTRRKKGAASMPDIKPEEIKSIIESITNEDESSFEEAANFGTIIPGCKVMARWKDGYYYSGTVQRREVDGRWAVIFDDGLQKVISPECLIKIAILRKGTSVLVRTPDDFYDPGIVCGHFREGNKVGYEVELDNGVTRRYTRFEVILSNDQAKLIMKNAPPTTPPTMTINLDNIVDGKRKRKSIQSPAPTTPPVKKSSRVTRSKKPDPNLDSTAAESSAAEVISHKIKDDETEEPPMKKKRTKKGAICATPPPPSPTPSVAGSGISVPSVASTTSKRSVGSASTSAPIPSVSSVSTGASISSVSSTSISTNLTVSKTVKVLPQRSKKLFKDYAFLLTNADRKPVFKPMDTSDSDIMKEEEDIVPFDKDELCSYIASGGGMVVEKFEDIKKCPKKHIYLLANSYLRTMKYIQCIAAGISCIKHHWVQNCIFKTEILSLNSYMLPAGFSLVTEQVIEWHGKTDVFKGCMIALVSAPQSPFVDTWAPVLLAAKADFVQKWNLPSSVSGCSLVVDVLITNNNCPNDIIKSAKKRKIPIVSSEWIIQCLIMGERIAYDAHPKFKYDYTEA